MFYIQIMLLNAVYWYWTLHIPCAARLPPNLFLLSYCLLPWMVMTHQAFYFSALSWQLQFWLPELPHLLNAGGSPLPLALSHAVPCVRFSSSSLFFYAFFGCLTCSKALQGSPQIALPFPNLRFFTLPSYSGLSALSHHLLKLLLLCFPARRWLMCPLGSVWRQTLSSTSLRIWKLWTVLGMWNPQQCLRRAEEVFLQDIWVNVLRW